MDKSILRRKILEMLYDRFCEHPYHSITPKEFAEILKVNRRQIDYNIVYLEEKGLVELHKPLEGGIFVAARITPKGIDLVEDEFTFNLKFPQTDATVSADLSTVLQKLKNLIDEVNNNAEPELKEILQEELVELMDCLQKNEISYTKIKKLVDLIRKKEKWVADEVLAILREPVVVKSLAESAKRELLD